ncbi:hypothetical protein NPIL_576991 [Nephila pilipes]|uniref:Uncharacterized protein n=1 Tax=Nephila pilipes TaxID=299642 RepID=A0A8X6UTY8_NEPPI|nr:hypothetical protein NPIL_576991 [Nephila pilipes]
MKKSCSFYDYLLSSCDAAICLLLVSVSYCNRGGWKLTLYAPSSGDSVSSRWNAKSEDDPLPGGDLLHKQAFQRQSASPAAGPERPSQDAASSNVTRTGRVIKPPQRLDL